MVWTKAMKRPIARQHLRTWSKKVTLLSLQQDELKRTKEECQIYKAKVKMIEELQSAGRLTIDDEHHSKPTTSDIDITELKYRMERERDKASHRMSMLQSENTKLKLEINAKRRRLEQWAIRTRNVMNQTKKQHKDHISEIQSQCQQRIIQSRWKWFCKMKILKSKALSRQRQENGTISWESEIWRKKNAILQQRCDALMANMLTDLNQSSTDNTVLSIPNHVAIERQHKLQEINVHLQKQLDSMNGKMKGYQQQIQQLKEQIQTNLNDWTSSESQSVLKVEDTHDFSYNESDRSSSEIWNDEHQLEIQKLQSEVDRGKEERKSMMKRISIQQTAQEKLIHTLYDQQERLQSQRVEHEQEINKLQSAIQNNNKANTELKSSIEELSKVTDQEEEPVYCIEKERAEHLEEIKIVTGKWKEAERNYKKLEKQSLSETDLLKRQLEETGMQIESQNSVLENERNLHKKEIQDLEILLQKRNDTEERNVELNRMVKQCHGEIEGLRSQLSEMTKEKEKLQHHIFEINQKQEQHWEEMEEQKKTHCDEIQSIMGRLEKVQTNQKESDGMKEKLKSVQKEMAILKVENNNVETMEEQLTLQHRERREIELETKDDGSTSDLVTVPLQFSFRGIEDQRQRYLEEIRNLKMTLQTYNGVKENNKKITDDLVLSRNEIGELQNKLKEAANQNDILQCRIVEVCEERNQHKMTLDEERLEHHLQIQSMEETVNAENTRLLEYDQLSLKIKTLIGENKALREDMQQMAERNKEQQTTLRNMQQKNEDDHRDIETQKALIQELHQNIEKLHSINKDERTRYDTEIDVLKSKTATLEIAKDIAPLEHQEKIDELTKELNEVQTEKKLMNQRVKSMTSENKKLRANAKRIKEEIDGIRSELSSSKISNDSLHKEIGALSTKVQERSDMESELLRTLNKNESLRKRIHEMTLEQDQKKQSMYDASDYQDKIQSLKFELEGVSYELKAEREYHASEISDLQEELNRVLLRESSRTQSLKDKDTELVALKREMFERHESILAALDRRNDEICELYSQMKAKTEDNELLRDRIRALSTNISMEKDQRRDWSTKQENNVQENIVSLRRQLQSREAELEVMSTGNETLKEVIERQNIELCENRAALFNKKQIGESVNQQNNGLVPAFKPLQSTDFGKFHSPIELTTSKSTPNPGDAWANWGSKFGAVRAHQQRIIDRRTTSKSVQLDCSEFAHSIVDNDNDSRSEEQMRMKKGLTRLKARRKHF